MTPTQAQRGAATSHLKRIFQACHRSGSLCEPSKGAVDVRQRLQWGPRRCAIVVAGSVRLMLASSRAQIASH